VSAGTICSATLRKLSQSPTVFASVAVAGVPEVEAKRSPQNDISINAIRWGLRFASTGKATVHKFAAAHRYLSYLRPSSAEQVAMLGLLGRPDDGRAERIVEEAKRTGQYMVPLHQDFSKFERGAMFQRNRMHKGLRRPALLPLSGSIVMTQSDDPRALDWYWMGRGRNYRWSGPNPRPKVLIPYSGAAARVAIEVVALDRADQPDQPVRDQVTLLDMRGETGGHPPGDVLDERRVGDDELLTGRLGLLLLVAPPQFFELEGFDVGVQSLLPLGPRMAA